MKYLLVLIALLPLQAQELEITWLANEGVMLSGSGHRVLIDAFVTEPYSIYRALDEASWAKMIAGTAPFEKVDLALVSHRHRDHFQAKPALAFLQAHPETRLISSRDVVDDLSALPGFEDIAQRVAVFLPDPGEVQTWQHGKLEVHVMRIAHSGQRWSRLHNLGHVIQLGDKRVLHLGDAGTDPNLYEDYRQIMDDLDVALIPYWYFYDEQSRRLIRETFPARVKVALHISTEDEAKVRKDWPGRHPDVVLFGHQLETYTIR